VCAKNKKKIIPAPDVKEEANEARIIRVLFVFNFKDSFLWHRTSSSLIARFQSLEGAFRLKIQI